MRRRLAIICSVATCVIVVMAAGSMIAGYALGFRVYSVQTASMRPALRPGDAVITRLGMIPKPGDVATYRSAADPTVLITHRLVGRSNQRFQFQGDALSTLDPTVYDYQLVGRSIAIAPQLGKLLGWLRSPLAIGTIVYVPIAIIMCIEILLTYRSLRQPTYRHIR